MDPPSGAPKKTKASSSANGSSSNGGTHGGDGGDGGGAMAPQQPQAAAAPGARPRRRLHFSMLSEPVHDVIASFLTNHDMMRAMEAGRWLLKVYGARVRELILSSNGKEGHEYAMLSSILSRRPGLVGLQVAGVEAMAALAEAMDRGRFERLRVLNIWDVSSLEKNPQRRVLFQALAQGACPRLLCVRISLNHYDADEMVRALGQALKSRMDHGCCGLRVLALESAEPREGEDVMAASSSAKTLSDPDLQDYVHITDMSPVLSSGACEALEELLLGKCYLQGKADDDVAAWLIRTKATHLRAFTVTLTPPVATALTSPGVAPKLQVLGIADPDAKDYDQQSLLSFLEVFGRHGVWPDLRELQVEMDALELSKLMEVLRVGAQDLTTLTVKDKNGPQCFMAMAQGLRDGACQRLEKLNVTTTMDDMGLMELSRALEGGAACSITLRALSLDSCDFGPEGMKELCKAFASGACRSLEAFKLSYNELGDESVVYLAEAMEAGALPRLMVLNLENVSMEDVGALALCRALAHHACPRLEYLSLSQNCISQEVKAELLQKLKARGGSCIVDFDSDGGDEEEEEEEDDEDEEDQGGD